MLLGCLVRLFFLSYLQLYSFQVIQFICRPPLQICSFSYAKTSHIAPSCNVWLLALFIYIHQHYFSFFLLLLAVRESRLLPTLESKRTKDEPSGGGNKRKLRRKSQRVVEVKARTRKKKKRRRRRRKKNLIQKKRRFSFLLLHFTPFHSYFFSLLDAF